ncbi:hypothetical protein QN277_001453 [Acacia crassicarpa]|uniref:Uncharacterized protein n=1 Tax=Acacia crassicarpa TaxID=499986 RepID=A0AAE1N8B5_9FABA|nr:hypothetical protein QN277_001453 [Acacia crassicarpa]
MKPVNTVYDLIEEAKVRTVWWALSIFAITYFLTHTSKSMWMNVPISVLLVCALRILLNKVEFHWKVKTPRPQTYLSHLEKKQLSLNDPRLSSPPPPAKWKRKIDSPVVEAAASDFIGKILKDFVIDLWYSDITPDQEFPQHIHAIIMDVLGEISGRLKEINLVDLLTRDIIDLVGDHLDLFRRNQAVIGVDVMLTLSSEERNERLKFHLLNSKELHPALVSPESEYKVLQRLMGGIIAIVLRQREVQCPVIRSIARELLTCLVMQPIMDLASPGYINELIETLVLTFNDEGTLGVTSDQSSNAASHHHGHSAVAGIGYDEKTALKKANTSSKMHYQQDPLQVRHAGWAQGLDASTQRRTEVLMPENLDNMWTKGRNYKKKEIKKMKVGSQDLPAKGPVTDSVEPDRNLTVEKSASNPFKHAVPEVKSSLPPLSTLSSDPLMNFGSTNESVLSQNPAMELLSGGEHQAHEVKDTEAVANKSRLKRSNSTSDLAIQPQKGGGPIISEFYTPNFEWRGEGFQGKSASDMIVRKEGQLFPKLRCRVKGAHFEQVGSKSFAVYVIAVTDAQNRTWLVKRRYRNFERLHRHLKDIPNYTLHLPPKRFLSSSTEDAFVYQRCIQLDKYLQDLLSIANVAEQHEVWDFLSVSSKNYSFGKSSSMMKTLAVNVDDAVDDIVRQFKGVSDGLMKKVVGSTSPINESPSTSISWNLSWNSDEIDKSIPRKNMADSVLSSDTEEGEKNTDIGHEGVDREVVQSHEWHSDNELGSKGYPARAINQAGESGKLDQDRKHGLVVDAGFGKDIPAVPPEWTPPNVSVPILNLVDNVFQLKQRGWLRRQVFWISKQILQLVMEDAIDDWLLRQINLLRQEETIAQGIRWIQDLLWPGGTFFTRVRAPQMSTDDDIRIKPFQTMSGFSGSKITNSESGSFEEELEAARIASAVKKLIFDGAPTALVGLIGQKQYRRCASDIYYFTQSTICVKQLAYAILELILISIFPEMRSLVMSVHENMHVHRPV